MPLYLKDTTITIGGERYYYASSHHSKRTANREAAKYRGKGYKARVRTVTAHRGQATVYLVYTRPKVR
jgi:hypothetical protein